MKVTGSNSGPIRPDRSRDPKAVSAPVVGQGARQTPSKLQRLDRVELSAQGLATTRPLTPVDAASAQRLAEIRQRVLHGAYNLDGVVDAVARRVADSGDV